MAKKYSASHLKRVLSSGSISFVLVILMAISVILICFFYIYRILTDVKVSQKQSDAMYVAQEVDYYLQKNKENLNLASVNIENYISEGKSHEDILQYMKQESKATSAVVDENFSGVYGWIDGEYLDGMDYQPDESYVPKERPWYIKASKMPEEVVFITPYIDSQTQRVIVSLSKMLEDGDSVLSMDIYLDYLQQLVSEFSENGQHLIILDDVSGIVAGEFEEEVLNNTFRYEKLTSLFSSVTETVGYSISETMYNGKKCFCYDYKIIGGWHVILMVEKSSLLSRLQYIYFIALFTISFALYVTLVLFHKINSQRIEAQNYSSRLATVADIYLCMYEIDMLEDTFTELKSMKFIDDVLKRYEGPVSEIIVNVIKDLCAPEEGERISKFADMTDLNERLAENKMVSMEVKGLLYPARVIFLAKNRDEAGNLTKVMLLIENIEDELAKRRELMNEANTDKLTGLYNRRAWEIALDEVRQNNNLTEITIVGFDLNGLKHVNDTLGHLAGDELIIGAANLIKEVFGQIGDAYRIGGDEYAVIIRNGSKKVKSLISIFRKKVENWKGEQVDSMRIAVGYSCGNSETVHSVGDLVRITDERMYEDKNKYYANKAQS